jgi:hypothetical protein
MRLLHAGSRPLRGAPLPSTSQPHRWHGNSSRPSHVVAVAAPERQAEQRPAEGVDLKGLNKFSSKITQPKSQGASQAMLYATGLREGDFDKPQVTNLTLYLIARLSLGWDGD